MTDRTLTPRVWFDNDDVPAGVWTYRVEETDPESQIGLLDADDPCGNVNLGPLVEILIPEDVDQIILSAAKDRGINVQYCTQCQEWADVRFRNGDDTCCYDCADGAEVAQ